MRLSNGKIVRTEPDIYDTDGDGLSDGEEMGILRRNGALEFPLINLPMISLPNNKLYIGNGTYSSSTVFFCNTSDPSLADTDSDGIPDDEELIIETDIYDCDSDNDGLDDGTELVNWFDPLQADADNDGRLDKQEYDEGTDPYNYDKNWTDHIGDFVYGFIAGDFIKETDSLPTLMGQLTSSFIPLVDIRDVVGNLVNGDYAFAGLSALGLIPVGGDAAKAAGKVGKFVVKNSDNAAKSAELIKYVSKNLPDVAKALENSEDIAKAAENLSKLDNLKISRSNCEVLTEVFENAGKADVLLKTSNGLPVKQVVKLRDGTWEEKFFERGRIIDNALNGHDEGIGLGKTFPVVDRLEGTTLVSTKSLDLGAQSYQTPSRVKGRLNAYLKDLDGFEAKYFKGEDSFKWKGKKLNKNEYDKKVLEIVLPDIPITESTQTILNNFISEAKKSNIEVWYVIGK